MTTMTPILWKALTDEQEKKFRQYSRDTYIIGSPIDLLWHPVCVHECYLMNKEAGLLKSDSDYGDDSD